MLHVWLLPAALAQAGAEPSPTGAEPAVQQRAGLATAIGNAAPVASLLERGGVLWAVGSSGDSAYKVRFDSTGPVFVPALGAAAPRNMDVAIRALGCGRGADIAPFGPAERHVVAGAVEYRRAAAVERYDVVPAGIEQSFVFDRLPRGTGDLVVRCDLDTEFSVTPDGAGLRLSLPGVGGMSIGGVTGVDAHGRHAAGSLRFDDGILELRLPGAFVDGAALPLTLDPLIGSVFQAVGNNLDDRDPDVAFDLTNDLYLAVFQRAYSAVDHDIHGQRIARDGSLVGSRIVIELSTTGEFDPAVANVRLRAGFVVAYERSGDIYARGVAAGNGAVSAEIGVATGSATQRVPDLGGEATTADDDAICVWAETSSSSIRAAQIQYAANGTLVRFDPTTIYSSAAVPPNRPRISNGGGRTGHHMIVYEVQNSVSDHDPAFTIVDRNLGMLEEFGLATTANDDQLRPAVDGDGRTWVVAWQTQEAGVPSKDDIVCRAIAWDPQEGALSESAVLSPIEPVADDADDAEASPTVVMQRGSVLVGWTDQDGSNVFNTYCRSLDPLTCTACESATQSWLDGSFAWDYQLAGCSDLAGGGAGDHSLLVFESYDSGGSSTGDVLAQRWEAVDGLTVDVGGGCGDEPGQAYASCAIRGNARFRAQAVTERTFALAWLVASRDVRLQPCGTCSLVPDPYLGFVVATQTDGAGRASFAAAIPNSSIVVGATLYLQWLVHDPLSPGCFLFGSDLTNAVRLTIQ